MFIPIVLNLFQYFLFSIFIYNIIGRRIRLSMLIALILVGNTVIETIGVYEWWEILIITAIPYILSQLAIMKIFKDYPVFTISNEKGNKRWMKKDKRKRITPASYDKRVSIILMVAIFIITIPLSILSFKDLNKFIGILILSIITMSGLLVRYIILNKIKSETIIIALGSNKDKLYELEITNINKRIMIEDVYQNEMYFTDYIGQIDLIGLENHRKHIYLISSNDLKEIDQGFEKIDDDTFLKDILSEYTRYNKTLTKLRLNSETNNYIIYKKRILK